MQQSQTDTSTGSAAIPSYLERARTLSFLAPPVSTAAYPRYPERPPSRLVPAGFTSTRHVAPAATPRLMPGGSLGLTSAPFDTPDPASASSSPTDQRGMTKLRRERAARAGRQAVDTRAAVERFATDPSAPSADPPSEQLFLAVERWTRDEPSGSITLVVTHGAGLIKEHGHLFASRAIAAGKPTRAFGPAALASHNTAVDEVWFIDDARVGCSADLNDGRLGAAFSVLDSARDLVNLVRHAMPAPGLAADEALEWHARPSERQVVGVAHSYSGSTMVTAAALDPSVFSSLFLIEPTITTEPEDARRSAGLTQGALSKPFVWPSQEAAMAAVTKAPFDHWHRDARELHAEHGLVPVPSSNGAVRLVTPPWIEGSIFAELVALKYPHQAAPSLSLPVGIYQGANGILTEDVSKAMLSRFRTPLREVTAGGHFDKPDEVADALVRFLHTDTSTAARARL